MWWVLQQVPRSWVGDRCLLQVGFPIMSSVGLSQGIPYANSGMRLVERAPIEGVCRGLADLFCVCHFGCSKDNTTLPFDR